MVRDYNLSLLIDILWRRRSVIAAFTIAGLMVSILLTMLSGREYIATGSFIPERSDAGSGALSGLAGQFGLSLPGGSAGAQNSPEFYAALINTRGLLRNVVKKPFKTADADSMRLPQILQLEGSPAQQVEGAIDWLGSQALATSVNRTTSVVTVRVRTADPVLSAALVAALLSEVDRYNVATRRTAGANERLFLEQRLAEKNRELKAVEDSLQYFLNHNRSIGPNAPALMFQSERLQRRVMLQQQVVASLTSSLEDARIREIRDTPTITVIEPPTVPLQPEARNMIAKAIIGLAFGLLLGIPASAAFELLSLRSRGKRKI